jgi:hypothetical protein
MPSPYADFVGLGANDTSTSKGINMLSQLKTELQFEAELKVQWPVLQGLMACCGAGKALHDSGLFADFIDDASHAPGH